jgi:hypothetical protein
MLGIGSEESKDMDSEERERKGTGFACMALSFLRGNSLFPNPTAAKSQAQPTQ